MVDIAGYLPNFTGMLGGIVNIIKIVFYFLVVFVPVFFFIIRPFMFPIKAIIWEKRGDSFVERIDRLKKSMKGGDWKYVFMNRRKESIPLIDYSYIMPGSGFFSKNIIYLVKLAERSYKPIKINPLGNPEVNYSVLDLDDANWLVSEVRAVNQKYQELSFWQKYQTMISTVMILGIILIIFIIMFRNLEGVAMSINNLADATRGIGVQTIK